MVLMFLQQRAKQHWLKDRDSNTWYFHHCANQRRECNFVACVEGRYRYGYGYGYGYLIILSNTGRY